LFTPVSYGLTGHFNQLRGFAALRLSLSVYALRRWVTGGAARRSALSLVAALLALARSSMRVIVVAAVAFPLATWLLLAKILAMPLP